jgi:uncharacterized surface protein with fasciclin (FAS1) repeats
MIRSLGWIALSAGLVLNAGPSIVAEEKAAKDIVDTAATSGQFKTLRTVLTAAELIDTLKGKGPFTVFAPNDKAFAKVPKEALDALLADKAKLKKILLAHVIVGKEVKAADVLKMNGEKVNGYTIDTKDGVKIGDAKVLKADVPASNGVIHVIDTVLMPKD